MVLSRARAMNTSNLGGMTRRGRKNNSNTTGNQPRRCCYNGIGGPQFVFPYFAASGAVGVQLEQGRTLSCGSEGSDFHKADSALACTQFTTLPARAQIPYAFHASQIFAVATSNTARYTGPRLPTHALRPLLQHNGVYRNNPD
jgi:hypothetical protein